MAAYVATITAQIPNDALVGKQVFDLVIEQMVDATRRVLRDTYPKDVTGVEVTYETRKVEAAG